MSDRVTPGRLQYGMAKVRMRPRNTVLGILALLVFALFAGTMMTCAISIGIWPGEAKLLEPILCTDARPDAIVVYDSYSPRPGETVTNFSLYCMGPRGDTTDHGWATVFFWLTGFHTVLVLALMGFFGARSMIRSRRRATTEQPSNPIISQA